jgi:hypothetical protein
MQQSDSTLGGGVHEPGQGHSTIMSAIQGGFTYAPMPQRPFNLVWQEMIDAHLTPRWTQFHPGFSNEHPRPTSYRDFPELSGTDRASPPNPQSAVGLGIQNVDLPAQSSVKASSIPKMKRAVVTRKRAVVTRKRAVVACQRCRKGKVQDFHALMRQR